MGELSSSGIPCTIIEDLAVGYIMGDVHCVMLGAEGVAESGGIINKVIFDYFWSIRWKKRIPILILVFTFTHLHYFSITDRDIHDCIMCKNVK